MSVPDGEPLTPREIHRLEDRAKVLVLSSCEQVDPRAYVLRWEIPGEALEAIPCLCGFNPETMDNDLVIARLHRGRIGRYKMWRAPDD